MSITDIVTVVVYDYLWGLPLVFLVLTAGAFLTLRTGFFQIQFFRKAFAQTKISLIGEKQAEKNSKTGVISSFEAMSMALGTTIGVGNIGGVATAIALGGPGAIFWMWIAGLFGLVIKTVEITLAVYYRSRTDQGESYGGPNYYMHKGIGIEKGYKKLSKFLSFIFAFGFILGIFLNIQTYTVSEAVAGTFSFNANWVAIVYTVALYIMISGGMKRIGKIATIIVPFMCAFYIIGGLIVIIINIENLIPSIGLIIKAAFNPIAATGGFAGSSVSLALKSGMSRSVFSNEAGWGSAPMIHASAKVNHPLKQGMIGIFEVFFDTIIVCSITGLVIIITGQWKTGLDGATLTLSAFETGMGNVGRIILAVGIFFFGLTTSSGVYTQIEVVLRYIFKKSKIRKNLLTAYKWFYPIPSIALVFIAKKNGLPGTTVWLFSDASTALPIFANILTLLILSPKFMKIVKDYKARYLNKGIVDNEFKVFFEGSDDENRVDKV